MESKLNLPSRVRGWGIILIFEKYEILVEFLFSHSLLYGAYSIIFGPDSIMVNRFLGPTFWEVIRLHPGLVASIGFGTVALGRLVRLSGLKILAGYTDKHFILYNKFGRPSEEKKLVVQSIKDSHFVIGCQKDEDETAEDTSHHQTTSSMVPGKAKDSSRCSE